MEAPIRSPKSRQDHKEMRSLQTLARAVDRIGNVRHSLNDQLLQAARTRSVSDEAKVLDNKSRLTALSNNLQQLDQYQNDPPEGTKDAVILRERVRRLIARVTSSSTLDELLQASEKAVELRNIYEQSKEGPADILQSGVETVAMETMQRKGVPAKRSGWQRITRYISSKLPQHWPGMKRLQEIRNPQQNGRHAV
jgi:hypothetical protein